MRGDDISMSKNSWNIEVSEEITSEDYVRCHKIFPRASEIAEASGMLPAGNVPQPPRASATQLALTAARKKC